VVVIIVVIVVIVVVIMTSVEVVSTECCSCATATDAGDKNDDCSSFWKYFCFCRRRRRIGELRDDVCLQTVAYLGFGKGGAMASAQSASL